MPLKIKSPTSYFFTDPTRVSQVEAQAFGPVPGSLERKFNLTNVFTKTGPESLSAFAVTDGILFIVPQKDSADLVNVFLKPTTPVDIGVKIKYYVYRSVKIENFFNTATPEIKLLSKGDLKILAFFNKIWDDFLEFNELTTSTNVSFEASKLGFSEADLKSYQNFFTKGQYTLPKIQKGEHIGNFDLEFGFEVVIDEGDFSQERSDTGFDFKDHFFRAKKCVLNIDGGNAITDYGNIPTTVSEKVFRESIYLFIDPVAYYGSHITDLKNNNAEGGSITVKESTGNVELKTITSIYNKIINKFLNKAKTYLYIKSFRGRSYNYYDNNSLPITISNSSTNQNIFNENLWPFRSLDISFNPLKLRLNIFNKNCLLFCNSGNSDFEFYDRKQLLSDDGTLAKEVSFYLPKSPTEKVASIIYLTYDSGKDAFDENLFGSINLNSIFEVADFSSTQKISWVSHSRNIITKRGEDITAYNTKTIIDSTSTVSEKVLKTLFISPVANNTENNGFTELDQNNSLQAGYITKDISNSQEFCFETFGMKNAEIWRGQIKDGSQTIKSLALRIDENINTIPSFVLGITKKDYENLESRIPNILEATNIYINLSSNFASDASSLQFAKYTIQLTYDNKLGEQITTTTPSSQTEVYLYTIDALFYFTSLYSLNFNFFSEFAKVTVDFRPRNDWMQYYKYRNDGTTSNPVFVIDGVYNDPNVFYGFDWLRKGDSEKLNPYRVTDDSYSSFYKTVGENSSTNPNDTTTVTVNPKLYINVKGVYRIIPMSWKLPDGPLFDNLENYTNFEPDYMYDKDYSPSWLFIPHITDNTINLVKLRLKIRCNQHTSSLKIYFNAINFNITKIGATNNPTVRQDEKYVQNKLSYIEIPTADIPANNKIKWIDFEFNNINPYNSLEVFKVFDGEKLAGKLYLPPNSSENIRYKKLLIIKVKHDNSANGLGEINNDELEILKIFSSHSNIKLKIDSTSYGILDLSDPTSPFHLYINSNGKIDRDKIIQGKNIYTYLLNLISGYEDYVKIFSLNLRAEKPKGRTGETGGATIEEQKVVLLFNSPMGSVEESNYDLAHEYLHSVGVAHTFTDKKIDENALLSFLFSHTNNVMDYFNQNITLRQFVQGTFFWQWAIARQNSSKNF